MRCSTTNEHPSQRQSLQTTTRMLRDSQPRAATCTPPRTATPSLGARKFKPVHFYTQNCRSLKTDAILTELIDVAQWRDAFASCLQETWRPQDHEELCDLEGGHTFIGVGQAHNSAGRGSQGVGILLSPSATRAWHLAKTRYGRSHLVNDLGPRVLAVTLTLQETVTKRAADVFLISAYAPTSAHSEDDWDAYYDSLSAALARCPPKAIAIIGSDANACIGTGEGERNDEKFEEGYEVVGRFGSTRVNDSGRRLRVYLETHQLCALTSFFPKKHYTTWTHPCSRLGYQLDYFFVFRKDLRRFRDPGSMAGQLIDSDHRALRASLDCKEPKKKIVRDARQKVV